MKLAVERTVLLGRPPYACTVQEDGTVHLEFCHDGVRLVAKLESKECSVLGVQVIRSGAIAEAVAAGVAESRSVTSPGDVVANGVRGSDH